MPIYIDMSYPAKTFEKLPALSGGLGGVSL